MYEVLRCTENDLDRFVKVVQSGGVVIFPTDTVYGIGCDPYNKEAVARVFAIKGRDTTKSLPVLTYSTDCATSIVRLDDRAKTLTEHYWPGALTIIAPQMDYKISELVTGGSKSIAVRVPSNICLLSVLRKVRFLIGTSANKSGMKAISDVRQFPGSGLDNVDAVLDGGQVGGIESTIIDLTLNHPRIVREGAVSSMTISEILGRL